MVTMGTQDFEGVKEEHEDIKLFWSNFDRFPNVDLFRKNKFHLIYDETHLAGGEEHVIIFAKKPAQ